MKILPGQHPQLSEVVLQPLVGLCGHRRKNRKIHIIGRRFRSGRELGVSLAGLGRDTMRPAGKTTQS